VDTLATPETVALFRNLKSFAESRVLFGHQDDLAYGVGWQVEDGRSDVKSVCGDYPAVYGWDIGDIGQEANVRVDAYPETLFKGKVTEVGSSALQRLGGGASTQESKDFKVVVTLESPPERLKPGLSASADIVTAEKNGVLTVPISALVLREMEETDSNLEDIKKEEEEGVYIVEEGRAKFQPVEKGIMGGMLIEIKSGLQENQEIISGPYAALREIKDGLLVKGEEKEET